MKAFKFVHTADLHLDSPFQGIGRVKPEIQTVLLDAAFLALQNIVQLCISEAVDFLLIAGDLYNVADGSLQAQLRCRDEFVHLTDHGIQVFVVHGNHDHCGGWRADLDWPEGVHFFPSDRVESISVWKEGEEIARVHGISYPKRTVTESYLPQFPAGGSSVYHIGLLHTNVGTITGYANYAPCTLGELLSLDYDYWALGHVHTYEVLHDSKPLIVYPGTPQGRHPLETGSKGCCLVEVDGTGNTTHHWVETDVLRWLNLEMRITGLARLEDLLAQTEDVLDELLQTAGKRGYMVQIVFTGRGSLYGELRRPGLLQDLLERFREMQSGSWNWFWVRGIANRTQPELQINALRDEESLLGDFLKITDRGQNLAENPEFCAILQSAYAPLFNERMIRKILTEPSPALLQELVRRSEELGIELFQLEVEN